MQFKVPLNDTSSELLNMVRYAYHNKSSVLTRKMISRMSGVPYSYVNKVVAKTGNENHEYSSARLERMYEAIEGRKIKLIY